MRRAAAVLIFVLLAVPAGGASSQVARGKGGAVAAAEENAAKAGIEILKKGGNAGDAAVAVAFALAVTWPEAGNIGGGGFWISRDVKGKTLAVDFREIAPRTARRDLFIKPGRTGEPPSSTEGPFASGVPGSVDGLWRAHRLAGRLPWKTVLAPAVRLARDGFVVTETISQSIAAPKYRKRLASDRETAAIFLPKGEPPVPGTLFRQPALARTLEAIRDRGSDGFYRGRIAREIEEGQRRVGGLITRGDLALYSAKIRRPARFRFGAVEIVTTTLNDSFGNARVAPGLGFLLNNEMDDFATKPGRPNLYGLIQGEVNAVAAGKRMLSAMCPSIAVLGNRNAFVWGSPGGSTIPTTNFQVLLGILLRGESLEEAVGAPRFHQQDFPDKIQLERSRFDSGWVEALRRIGHTVEEREPDRGPLGRVHAIARGPDGTVTAVADPRSGGVGLVVLESR